MNLDQTKSLVQAQALYTLKMVNSLDQKYGKTHTFSQIEQMALEQTERYVLPEIQRIMSIFEKGTDEEARQALRDFKAGRFSGGEV